VTWIRARFKADGADFRPISWPPPGPYWCSGYGDDYSIVIAYVRDEAQVYEFWPEAEDVDSTQEVEIKERERRRIAIWWGMSPEARDYDRHVARRIPAGLPADERGRIETDEYRAWLTRRSSVSTPRDFDDDPGCTCHINPPCSWCMERCPESEDGTHCDCWWDDATACCWCSDDTNAGQGDAQRETQ
jgi:hypothetical protein